MSAAFLEPTCKPIHLVPAFAGMSGSFGLFHCHRFRQVPRLVDEATPIVILAPFDSYFEKSASNMSEVMARGGQVVFITDPDGQAHAPQGARVVVTAPRCDPLIAPLVYAPPIQLLAYHVAVQKGADVDQPRNLAKSVTVE